MASVLTEKYFYDEAAAFAKLEEIRWPDGPTCPHCGAVDRINRLEGMKDRRDRARLGLWKCYHCRSQLYNIPPCGGGCAGFVPARVRGLRRRGAK